MSSSMFSRDEFIYHHGPGRVEARQEDSRYRLAQLTGDRRRVLDAGCAVGYIGEFIRRSTPERWLAGIELDPRAAEQARPYYDQLVVGSLADEAVWRQLRPGIDAIIFGDVLEHTSDPVQVLRMAAGVLSDDGLIVVSLPNIAFFKMRLRLLLGKFDYEEGGIMDRTHLRFFTLTTGQEMLRLSGFRVVHLEGIHAYPPPDGLSPLGRAGYEARARLKALLSGLSPSLFAYQFILVGVPA